jgi:hypothetical protein
VHEGVRHGHGRGMSMGMAWAWGVGVGVGIGMSVSMGTGNQSIQRGTTYLTQPSSEGGCMDMGEDVEEVEAKGWASSGRWHWHVDRE